MRRIIKQKPPHELKNWFNSTPKHPDGRRYNCSYESDMPGDLKNRVRESLLQEQGYLCCYTGIRISLETSHIEHLKPQSESRRMRDKGDADYDDTSYTNMVAAYPKKDSCAFGARKRADTPLPISPLDKICEQSFKFTQFGTIQPARGHDTRAVQTINILALDDASLTDMRKHAIETALLKSPLTEKALERIVQSYCEPHSHSQQMRPFCFVIQQVAADLLERKRKVRVNKRYRKKHK